MRIERSPPARVHHHPDAAVVRRPTQRHNPNATSAPARQQRTFTTSLSTTRSPEARVVGAPQCERRSVGRPQTPHRSARYRPTESDIEKTRLALRSTRRQRPALSCECGSLRFRCTAILRSRAAVTEANRAGLRSRHLVPIPPRRSPSIVGHPRIRPMLALAPRRSCRLHRRASARWLGSSGQ